MTTQTVLPDDVQPGRQIEFKRGPGKGRPALGKTLAVGGENVIVMLNDGTLDDIKRGEIRKVIKNRGKAAVTELERFAAIGYASESGKQLEVA